MQNCARSRQRLLLVTQDAWPVCPLRRIAGCCIRVIVLVFVALTCAGRGDAQQSPADYSRTEAMIPMRDGVHLYTQIDAPAHSTERLPILFLRTPYGLGDLKPEQVAAALPELSGDGYIIVRQDIRGRFKSEGDFVMLRQPRDRRDKKAIDESTDTYDTIEWLLAKVPNHNGRVGMAGTSYSAWLSVMGMLDPHPALKAVVQQASPADMWIGDDFHHNGAFRLSYGFEYSYMMESSKEISNVSAIIDRRDAYEWYLNLGPLRNANEKYFPVIDRNPQKFVPNIFLAAEADFQPATQRVFRSGRNASHIVLPGWTK